MRVLVAGWVNSPHVTEWAMMLAELDYEVVLVGRSTPAWPAAPAPAGVASCEELHPGGVPFLRSVQLGRELSRIVQRVRPALVHAHWLPEYGWLAARAGLHPLVSSAWGSDVLGSGALARRRSAVAVKGADLVLADSAALAEETRRLVPDGPRIEVFHRGVDVERFGPGDREASRRVLGWPAEVPIVLSPRALTPLYNHRAIIRAAARVRAVLPGLRLVLKHSPASQPAWLTTAIREADMLDSVDFVGHLDAGTMPALYRAADLVVSIPSTDSSPATAWEALACGRALVVSDLPWARAELRHGENAWLAPVDDSALADAFTSILQDRQLAIDLGSRGRELVVTTMDRRVKMRELDRRYRSLVGSERLTGEVTGDAR